MKLWPGEPIVTETARGVVEYDLAGSAGPLVIGLHGSPGSCYQMNALLDRLGLTGENCRRLTLSRPGYGRTPLASGKSLAEQSALLAALLDRLRLNEPAAVVGFSGGGVSALEFASACPERVAKLILLSPVTGRYAMFGRNFPERIGARMLYCGLTMRLAVLLEPLMPRLTLWFILKEMNHISGADLADELDRLAVYPDDREYLLNMLRRNVPFRRLSKGIWNDDRNVLAADIGDYFNLTLPILMFHGEHDADVSIRQSEMLHELLPGNTELVRLPKGGHLLLVRPYLELLRRRVAEAIA